MAKGEQEIQGIYDFYKQTQVYTYRMAWIFTKKWLKREIRQR